MIRLSFIAFFVAIGVGAGAQVSWTDINPDLTFDTDGDSYALDMNNDGITDFNIRLSSYNTANSYDGMITIEPLGNNSALSVQDDSMTGVFYSNALTASQMIGPDQAMCSENEQTLSVYTRCESCTPNEHFYGEWNGASENYVGVSVEVDGEDFYGWIKLDVMSENTSFFTVKEYALADVPNTKIPAGSKGIEISVPEPEDPEEWGIFFEPQNERIMIEAAKNQLDGTDYYICSISGQKIEQGSIAPYMIISTNNWRAGFYFMYLTSPARGEAVIKFFVD